MEITIDHHGDQFNINLHGKAGADPFLTIKGCRIVQGQKGPFVSYPARKMDNGKYWQHVYGGEKFNEAVLRKATGESRPHPPSRPAPPPRPAPRASADYDDIPF